MISFDIETMPQLDRLEELYPYEPPAVTVFTPKQDIFDPASVKLGAMKDEAKIKAKIQAAEEKFHADLAAEKEAFEKKLDEHKATFWDDLIEKAALNPFLCQIIAIGVLDESGARTKISLDPQDEPHIIEEFFETYRMVNNGRIQTNKMIGWNIHGFDLPRIHQRANFLRLNKPAGMLQGRYWDSKFIDIMKEWECHQYGKYDKLERVAKFLGVAQLREHKVTGKDFWKFARDEPAKAEQYLHDDLQETLDIAEIIL